MFADPLGSADELIAELNRAYPGLGEPDERFTGPGDTYEFLAYNFASGDDLNKQGLWGTYVDGETGQVVARHDNLGLRVDPAPFEPPYQVTWTGLVHIEDQIKARLSYGNGVDVEVLIDGSPEVQDLIPGWHVVEAILNVDGAPPALEPAWVDENGNSTGLQPRNLFPLEQLNGWRHTRSMGLTGNPTEIVTQRLDFSPHIALASVLQMSAPSEQFVTEERWDGVLQLEEASSFALRSEFRAGTVTILIDGEEVGRATAQESSPLQANVDLAAGRHTIQLLQTMDRETTWSGATLSIIAADGSEPVVTPY